MFICHGINCILYWIEFATLQLRAKTTHLSRKSKYACDRNFYGHFCPRQKAANFCYPGSKAINYIPRPTKECLGANCNQGATNQKLHWQVAQQIRAVTEDSVMSWPGLKLPWVVGLGWRGEWVSEWEPSEKHVNQVPRSVDRAAPAGKGRPLGRCLFWAFSICQTDLHNSRLVKAVTASDPRYVLSMS